MKIALVIPSLVQQGGGERQFLYLARGLIERGHEVVVYTINYDKRHCYPALARGLGIKSIYYCMPRYRVTPFLNVYLSYINLYINLKKMAGMIDKEIDIINLHGDGMPWLVLRLPPAWKGKFVWMCNDTPTWIEVFRDRERKGIRKFKNFLDRHIYSFISYYDRKAMQKVSSIVTLSREMKNLLESYYKREVNLLRSGIDIERFNNCDGTSVRKRYGIMPQDFLLLHVSLLQPLRRIEDVLSAVAILRHNYPGLKILIVGSLTYHIPYVRSLKRMIEEKKLDSSVILAGEVPDEEIPLYYNACDGFIFPSDRRQSWGLVVFEAMASKKPVIVSSECGASEVLKDGIDALFISPGNISEMVTQIRRIIEDSRLRERISEEGYKFVRENLSWDKYTQRMEEIFLGRCS